ncbi:hydroxymethylbilane synthase [Camelimonas abortus]|uniref:Porphobilinogen deaminase n=1 Tax=Camelimonas abortus TaxID=1017184 RepID=A0ABV7LD47_9HYPH
MSISRLVVGTRGSPLALAQANIVRDRLVAALGLDPAQATLQVIRTTGDMIQDRALAEAGGKGLFTKELDSALLAGDIDLAVHSAKDLPTWLPDELVIAGYLEREDVRDVLIAPGARGGVAALPAGAVVGTASLRRAAQIRRLRPDVSTGLLRGNVHTRLARLHEGRFDATLLALAGLRRLGVEEPAATVLGLDEMLPAVGQGAIAITARAADEAVREALARIIHADTGYALAAERAFLTVLDGSCRTPIAGLAQVDGDRLRLRGLLLSVDGQEWVESVREGHVSDAAALGEDAGREIQRRASPALLQQAGR